MAEGTPPGGTCRDTGCRVPPPGCLPFISASGNSVVHFPVGVTLPTYLLSHFSRVQLFATPWIIGHQAPLSMGFSRQEYWNELPFPSPGELPNLGIELASPCISFIADRLFYPLSHLGSPILPK